MGTWPGIPSTVGLCSAAKLAICSRWSAVTVSPTSAMADTRNAVAPGSNTHGLGKPMALDTLVRFRLAWPAARNLPGTALRQRPSAEGCSVDEVSHLAICPFVSERKTQKPSKSAKTEQPSMATSAAKTLFGIAMAPRRAVI